MSIIDLYCAICRLYTKTVAPALSEFQFIMRCVQYMDSQTHKLIFYPSSSHYGSNVIRLTWIGNQVEYHKTQNFWNVIKMQMMPEFST